ncbi:hypothetical protein [Alloyangia pacifica]|uniref:hypothetical protein n=1 Tax=Alloyangia pacifica TaxID=311180 RepID=UPI001C409C26|nr:hypothetical protein [Alloyangia pacifica]
MIENGVADATRGRRGYRQAARRATRDMASEAGCDKLLLATGATRESTLSFYESAGVTRGGKTHFKICRPCTSSRPHRTVFATADRIIVTAAFDRASVLCQRHAGRLPRSGASRDFLRNSFPTLRISAATSAPTRTRYLTPTQRPFAAVAQIGTVSPAFTSLSPLERITKCRARRGETKGEIRS